MIVRALVGAVLMAGAIGCSNQESRIPLDVMASKSFQMGDGTTIEAREFVLLEPTIVDTGLVLREGTVRLVVRFESTETERAPVEARSGGELIRSCIIEADGAWQTFDLPVASSQKGSLDLVFSEPGRYSLGPVDLVEAPAL